MTPSFRDRLMSLHRRAYACKTPDEWGKLAEQLDCPVDARDQFWKTANVARKAGMSPEKAFPLSGEVTCELSLTCLPGDLVWWRNAVGEIVQGELIEFDNGTASVQTKNGTVAIRCT